MANYAWKKGYPYKVPAQVAGEMCKQLEENGGLTAKKLVEANRPKDAPLHDAFEWNNREAAEKWREQQARVMIASLVTLDVETEHKEPVRAFFNISYTDPDYESIEVIIQSEDKHAALLNRAMNELKAFQMKYRTLTELNPVFEAINNVEVA